MLAGRKDGEINMNGRKYELEENELLYRICYKESLPSPHGFIFNSCNITNLAGSDWSELKISRYKGRKYLKSWESQGLIFKVCDGGQDENGNPYCFHGYSTTEKMKKTAIWQQAWKDVCCYIDEFLAR